MRSRRPLPFDRQSKQDEFEGLKADIAASVGLADPLGAMLHRNCCQYQDVLKMLAARGTHDFYKYSRELYGSTHDRFAGDRTTVRELGQLLYDILAGIRGDSLGAVYPKTLTAEQVVDRLNERFGRIFADEKIHAKLDDGILSDAAAGSDYVKIKRGSMFSEREVDIMEVHEGWVHIGTTLNGSRQPVAAWLSKGPPCATAVQEGLAVIMEVITFTASPLRTQNLSNRILACGQAEDGASFLDVFEFYRSEGYSDRECFRNAQRVFRGGVAAGGAPFTKDINYCKGFVMVYNFLRTAIRFGRPELIPFLFAGKVTLEDVPHLYRKFREGVIDAPRYLPPQFRDLNGLAMWMAYSNFFNRVDLEAVQTHYREQFA